jgi:hypothetical protein
VGDLNGDTQLDIVVVFFRAAMVTVFLGRGDGTFDAPRFLSTPRPMAVALGDLNSDAIADIVTADQTPEGGGVATVLVGRGDGTFDPPQSFGVGARPAAVAVADLNGDGGPDLITTNAGSNDVSVLLGQDGAE